MVQERCIVSVKSKQEVIYAVSIRHISDHLEWPKSPPASNIFILGLPL